MRACAIIPALDAARTVGSVVAELCTLWPDPAAVFVVDDGSRDDTARIAAAAGARVLRHPENRGKGAALRTGMLRARELGFDAAVTVDADGQHPPREARRLLDVDPDAGALVLGVRDLVAAGAPPANQFSNGVSNYWLSLFARRPLRDTQCGLRRYPLPRALELDARDTGYAFEAEIILRAIAARLRIVEVPIDVIYPRAEERITHFDNVRDPARIIARVVKTLVLTRGLHYVPPAPATPRLPERAREPEPIPAPISSAAP